MIAALACNSSTFSMGPWSPLFVWFGLVLLGLNLWHMDVPRLGMELELQYLAYTTATATQDLSHIGKLHNGT